MAATVIITRDGDLRQRIQKVSGGAAAVVFVEDCDGLEDALSSPMRTVVIDLNLSWDQDIAHCVNRCRTEGGAQEIIAFLHEQAGESAIRAHLAGADRIISQEQLEDEIRDVIGG